MNETQKAKITRFVQDKLMAETVKDVILKEFLKPSPTMDVQTLAASRIAIDLLNNAFKELDRYAVKEDKKPGGLTQIGL